jgi:environmental stress-induced protein Ves
MSTATLAENMTVSVIRVKDLLPSPWKNGTGVTREVANHPAGAGLELFAWRVSIADVAAPGPFSQFEGVDRTLILLACDDMRFTESSGHVHVLGKMLDVARFPGESQVDAELLNGATRDFNLMVSRRFARSDLTVWRGGPFETKNADTLLFFCAQGHTQIV